LFYIYLITIHTYNYKMTDPSIMGESSNIDEQSDIISQYINQLTEQEQIVLKIAIDHLESSFDILKSIGFIEWKKTNILDK